MKWTALFMDYYKRFADGVLAGRLQSSGAVLIEGAKGCGKTETAIRQSASAVRFDADEQARIKMGIDPRMVLEGEAPLSALTV
jgi:serine kinase of HPr protein (carbohydrate metabolism regulator)